MIGRTNEIKRLNEAFASEQSEFVALYGRRRVGKTFLVNETFGGRYAFQHSGAENAGMRDQLAYFQQSLSVYGNFRCPRLANWREAFFELEKMLLKSPSSRKIVFLDEVPWMDTPKSGFLSAFEHFWNGWASLRKDILLIICGSATSWIVNKVLNNRGGLHNRVTRQLPIPPFTLKECEEYAAWKKLAFDRRQIAECYMALGGVAYYWSLLLPEFSVAQNIDYLFFRQNSELGTEFGKLFASLFKHDAKYVEIVTALASRASGMTREELLAAMPSPCGGEISRYLQELDECGFIRRYNVIGTIKRGAIYKLVDNFVLFHFKFLKNRKGSDEHFWELSYDKPALNAWRGLSFERLCLWHIPQIKRALGISGILASVYSWRGKSNAPDVGDAQIDMLIDRSDRIINVCEMKFTSGEYAMTKEESEKFQRRIALFKEATKTRKGVMPTLVTSYGMKRNPNSGFILAEVTLDDLFAE